jgi:hypothetical protein
MSAEEATFTLTVSESELTLLVSALSHMEKRQLYLEALARTQGREKEARARRESAATTLQLAEKL